MSIYRNEEAWMQLMERRQVAITKKLPIQAKPLTTLDEWVVGAQGREKEDEATLQEEERKERAALNVE